MLNTSSVNTSYMDSDIYETVYQQAKDVRQWAWELATQIDRNNRLAGWCAVCSTELWHRLEAVGISAELHFHCDRMVGSHVFLLVDNHIIDITATQFDEFRHVPIVIIPSYEGKNYSFYATKKVFHRADKLRSYIVSQDWPPNQTPFPAMQSMVELA